MHSASEFFIQTSPQPWRKNETNLKISQLHAQSPWGQALSPRRTQLLLSLLSCHCGQGHLLIKIQWDRTTKEDPRIELFSSDLMFQKKLPPPLLPLILSSILLSLPNSPQWHLRLQSLMPRALAAMPPFLSHLTSIHPQTSFFPGLGM